MALGVVHYCFEDKDELFAALATRIVDSLAAAGAAGVRLGDDLDLASALRVAIAGLWESIEAAPGEQLLTYEITTHALRTAALRTVAEHQYAVSQAAAEALLTLAATASGATWTRPVAEVWLPRRWPSSTGSPCGGWSTVTASRPGPGSTRSRPTWLPRPSRGGAARRSRAPTNATGRTRR